MDNLADLRGGSTVPYCGFNLRKRTGLTGPGFALLFVLAQMNASASAEYALADLSLEELAALQVISVSKTAKPVSAAPASVFVITERDVRRSGTSTLPEALRLAPNLQVARIDAHNYAVTARGFFSGNAAADKLQVLIDGRTIYSPLSSGVSWDSHDLVLEDLDRIEVVSGAGGALWGANAVNGVINVVTRSAADTQGGLVSLGGGSNEQHAVARYGDSLYGEGHYRVYAKYSEHDTTLREDGTPTQTGWKRTQAGFRADWGNSPENFTLQGDAFSGRLQDPSINHERIEISGANILARGAWELSPVSRLSVQAYIDHMQRDHPTVLGQRLDTFDLDLQHEWRFGDRQEIVWGGGYRYGRDRIDNIGPFAILPMDLDMHWRNIFVQDEIALTDSLQLTLGVKMEDNPYTGWETMPGTQLAWTINPDQLLWTSLSRAVRSPSRADRDFYAPNNPPVFDGVPQYIIAGGPEFESEVADVFELGYRSQPTPSLSWSATAFYSEYDKLRTLEFNSEFFNLEYRNMAEAKTYGMEIWGSWQATTHWRLHGGFVAQEFDVKLKPGSGDWSLPVSMENADPRFYGQVRSSYDFSEQLAVDAVLRRVGELEDMDVPAYTALDLHIGWKIGSRLEVSLIGQNLLGEHAEFGSTPGRSVYERAFYGKLVWGL